MSDLKICVRCRHFAPGWVPQACAHPSLIGPPSLVDGEPTGGLKPCYRMRAEDCGVEGRLFEPHPPDPFVEGLRVVMRRVGLGRWA